MRQYARNVLRGVRKNLLQYAGVVLIIALAVSIFIGLYDYARNLGENVFPYFEEYSFADIFADVDGITQKDLEDLTKVEGVGEIFGRQSADVRLDTGEKQIVTLHLLAYSPADSMNKMRIASDDGTMEGNEIFLSQAMQGKRHFEIGDTLAVIYKGTRTELSYAGMVNSPQYLFYVPSSDIQAPVDDLYAFAAVDADRLGQITGKSDAVNEIGIKVEPGVDPDSFVHVIEARLKEKGSVLSICARRDQDAYNTLTDEIDTYELVSMLIPVLFLIGAAFMVYIILKKAIDSDRTIIGTLKAMGARDSEILRIYMGLSFILGMMGTLIAYGISYPIGNSLLVDSATYYSLPHLSYHFFAVPRIIGMVFGVGTALLSTWLGVREVMSIQPSEAMRASQPRTGNVINLPGWIDKRLNGRQRIAIKAIFRNPLRSVAIAFSISFPIALISTALSLTTYMNDSSDKVLQIQEAGDYKLVLSSYVPYEDLRKEILALDHVVNAEPYATFPVTLRYGNVKVSNSICAYDPGGSLRNVMDNRNHILTPSSDALFVDSLTADKLGVEEGDCITIQENIFGGHEMNVPIGAIYDTYAESCAYLPMDAFCSLFGQEACANMVLCAVEKDHKEDFLVQLKDAVNLDYIVDNDRLLVAYWEMNVTLVVIAYVVALFAIVSGGVMIYSIISMNLRERKVEFGTMMVLGMRPREIMEMILVEQLVSLAGGVLMTAGLLPIIKYTFETAMGDDGFLCDLLIRPGDYLMSLTGCAVVTFISVIMGYREVLRVNLSDVLKERG